MYDEADAKWRAHMARMLSMLVIKVHDPKRAFGEEHVLELTRIAEDIARSYDEDGSRTHPLLEAVLRIVESDPHVHGTRPCESCRTISGLMERPFGCGTRRAK